MIVRGSERGPVALPVFKTGRCPLRGQAGFDSQALPPIALRAIGVEAPGRQAGRLRPAASPRPARLHLIGFGPFGASPSPADHARCARVAAIDGAPAGPVGPASGAGVRGSSFITRSTPCAAPDTSSGWLERAAGAATRAPRSAPRDLTRQMLGKCARPDRSDQPTSASTRSRSSSDSTARSGSRRAEFVQPVPAGGDRDHPGAGGACARDVERRVADDDGVRPGRPGARRATAPRRPRRGPARHDRRGRRRRRPRRSGPTSRSARA